MTPANEHAYTSCQLKSLCQPAIWSKHDHHMQSAHPGWHRFTKPTLQLPSSCQQYSRKPNSAHAPQWDPPVQGWSSCQKVLERGQCHENEKLKQTKHSMEYMRVSLTQNLCEYHEYCLGHRAHASINVWTWFKFKPKHVFDEIFGAAFQRGRFLPH